MQKKKHEELVIFLNIIISHPKYKIIPNTKTYENMELVIFRKLLSSQMQNHIKSLSENGALS
jgi:hypothetical protein